MRKSFYGDESGSITTSDIFVNRFFVIGFVGLNDTDKIQKINRDFRKLKVKYIEKNNLDLDYKKEIKGSQMSLDMQIYILEKLCKKHELTLHYAIIDNHELYEKLRKQPHITFNYLINTYFKDNHRTGITKLKLRLDDRNKALIDLKDLEFYLKNELYVNTDVETVEVSYHLSHNVPMIQIADIFCNMLFRYATFFMNAKKSKAKKTKQEYINAFTRLSPYIECFTSFPKYRSSFVCPHNKNL